MVNSEPRSLACQHHRPPPTHAVRARDSERDTRQCFGNFWKRFLVLVMIPTDGRCPHTGNDSDLTRKYDNLLVRGVMWWWAAAG